jgi:hypothetical protein
MVKLSGGASDTLYRLFWFGAVSAEDIPSKAGMAELIEHEFVRVIDRKVVHTNCPKAHDQIIYVLTGTGYCAASNLYIDPTK